MSQRCPDYPADVRSLVGVLAWQRAQLPGRIVCHRIVRRRHDLVAEPLTVEALAERAARAAAHLRARGVRAGGRVILSLGDPHDFLVAFVGSLMAGAAAVPLPTTGEAGAPRSFAARVRAVLADCGPALVVAESRARLADVLGGAPDGIGVVEPADLDAAVDVPAVAPGEPSASAPAFIQYTSGSTGSPKGVVVTHGNIVANCRAIRDATGYTRADRMVSWLPLHHDMGLVGGLLTSIYCAAETWLMPPMAFLARPVTWLEAITAFRATLTVAPTFAYGLCARKVPEKQLQGLDLSSLRLAYIGAEPIDHGTVTAFVERFGPYGLPPTAIYPVYGLAEATLAASFPEPGTPLRTDTVDRGRLAQEGVAAPATGGGDGVTFVSVGRPLPEHTVDVVDVDDGRVLGERRVGELVVRGASVTPRYFADGADTVRARLCTGDLGYRADGQLYVVDRIKDLVIIAGRNYAPSDIEQAVADVPGLRRGRIVAFSAPAPEGGEALHVAAEVSATAWRLPDELAADVRRTIRREIGLAVATVSLVAPGTLERTSSGKIKRRACAEAHRAGTLPLLRTRADVLALRAGRFVELLRHRGERSLRAVAGWIGMAPSAPRS